MQDGRDDVDALPEKSPVDEPAIPMALPALR